jgi:hypothetical protein
VNRRISIIVLNKATRKAIGLPAPEGETTPNPEMIGNPAAGPASLTPIEAAPPEPVAPVETTTQTPTPAVASSPPAEPRGGLTLERILGAPKR